MEPWLEINGQRLLNLSSNNYLGLATHPDVQAAAAKAAQAEGCGAGSSRLIAGTSPSQQTLEERLAQFKGVESHTGIRQRVHRQLRHNPSAGRAR